MIRWSLRALLVSVCVLVAGCAGQHREPCPVAADERSVAIEEIDAAGKLDFDPSRAEFLSQIAARPGLRPDEQQHLVCVALHRLDFDPSRVEVLKTLIRNPDFSPAAKGAILRNLHLIDFDPARSELMREMQDRGDSSRQLLNP
jgi:hypothetical protein